MARYRIENWSAYNRSLVARGSLTVWMSEEAVERWRYRGPTRAGGQYQYSDFAIESCLRLRLVYHLALRQTQGFVSSLLDLLQVELSVPDYSTLSRRAAGLEITLRERTPEEDEAQHVVLDSTGLKVYGEGEWKRKKHGSAKRRTWRKVHLSVNPKTGEITATTLTENSAHDSSQTEPLLEEAEENGGPLERVGTDGAYDTWASYDTIEAHGATPVIPPQRNAKIRQHGNCKAPPLPRDEAIRFIRRHGRAKWKRESGYHARSRAESAFSRFKRLIGRRVRAHRLEHQQVEVRLGVQILNHMAALGMPQSVPATA